MMDNDLGKAYIVEEMAYFQALIVSFSVHALVMIALWKMAPPIPSSPPLSIDVISSQQSGDEKQIVRQVEIPEELLRSNDDDSTSSLLSERHQRVKEQVRARESGLSVNRSGKKVKMENILNPPRTMVVRTKVGDVGPSQKRLQPQKQKMSQHEKGGSEPSTLSDRLKGSTKTGDFNALNTDRFVYYSYYERINSAIHGPWEGRIKEILYQYQRQGAVPKVPKPWITEVEVLLTPQGGFHTAVLHSSSGIEAVDHACVRAFSLGAPFLNPPKGMIQKDGFIHVYYNFGVFIN